MLTTPSDTGGGGAGGLGRSDGDGTPVVTPGERWLRTDGSGGPVDRYRLLCERLGRHGVLALDTDGTVTDWSAGAARLLDYDRDRAAGLPLSALYPEDAADDHSERLLSRADADGEVVDEGWLVRADGSRFWGRTVVVALRANGTHRGYGLVLTDLSESPDKLREYGTVAVDGPLHLVGFAEPDGTVVEMNRTALEFAGVERGEVVGSPLWTTPWWADDDEARDRLRDAFETAAGGETVRYEAEAVGADGEAITVDLSLTPVTDDAGAVIGVVPEGRDVTERERVETALRERNRMFSTLVSNLPGVAYRCQNERGWPMSFVSDGCADLTGYDPAAIESGAVSWGEDVIHPDDREDVWDEVQRALDADERFTLTYRIRRADGEERWVWEQGTGVREDGDLVAIEGFITDVTDRRERQRRLEAVFDQTYQFTGLLDPDGTLLEANETALTFGGLDRDDVVGQPLWETPWLDGHPESRRQVRAAVERAADGEFVRRELSVRGRDRTATIDFSLRPIPGEDGHVELIVAEGRDITERVHRESQLATLNEVSRELTTAADRDAVCEVAVRAARETLGLELTAVDLYDADRGQLDRAARTDAATELVGDGFLLDPVDGEPWRVFAERDAAVVEEATLGTGESSARGSAVLLPLGEHGVLVAGTATTGEFTDTQVDLARVLSAHVETALDRIEREQRLQERTATLERKNERLNRLDRINAVMRDITTAFVGADSREDVLSVVCRKLAAAGPYTFAWIGRRDSVSREIRPAAAAGRGDGYLDAVTATVDDDTPAARALREGHRVAVEPGRSGPPFPAWEEAAIEREFRRLVAVPLGYDDATYGVLTVATDDADHLDEDEQAMLGELAETAGYAITAVERKAALMSERSVELKFTVGVPDSPLFRCAEAVGGRVELAGVLAGEEGPTRVFATVRDADPERVRSCLADEAAVGSVRHVAGDATESLFEWTVVGDALVDRVFDHGGAVQDVRADGDEGQVVVELPGDRSVREFVELFERRYPSARLDAQRERDRPVRTVQQLRADLLDRLTDRQLEAVETAYHSGFFEWPRDSTGEEVAEALDVSQPTFNRHLRASQRKLFELLLEDRQ